MSRYKDLALRLEPGDHFLGVHTWFDHFHRNPELSLIENETAARMARELRELVPEAELRVAHGQMRERDLERIMLDFYHRRFNVLRVRCTRWPVGVDGDLCGDRGGCDGWADRQYGDG